MQVFVDTIGTLERRVKVVLPQDILIARIERRILELAKNVKIPGFRPGKVPMDVVRQRYANTAREEAMGELIQSSLQEALTKEKLNPATTPNVEPLSLNQDGPLEFSATFEVIPEIKEVNFNTESLEKENVEISDADIDLTFERIRKQQASLKLVDRKVKTGDSVQIDFNGKINGESFDGGKAKDFTLVLGEGRMVPGFEEGIVGMTANDEKSIKLTFPKDYFSKDFAGKEAEFDIKLISVSEVVLPEVNAEFIKNLGIVSGEITDLRAEVKRNLLQGVKEMLNGRLKNRVFALLLEQNPLEVPKALIDRESQRLHQQSHSNNGKNSDETTSCKHTAKEMQDIASVAKNNVILSLLLAELIRLHKLEVEPERLQNQLNLLSASYENPDEVVRWYNRQPKALEELRMQLLEEKVLEKLLENAHIKEKQISYQELQDQVSV